MKKRHAHIIFFLVFATVLSAASWKDNLVIHGFVAQGYIYSDKNDYFVVNSQDGSTEFSEAALNVQSQLSGKLNVGMQFLARDFGDLGNNEVSVDWAFADYRFSDYFGIRVGKVKTPMGLYNEGRDIDFLRPMVFLPQSTYDEQYRSYLVATQGFNAYGNIPLHWGDFDYKAYIGNMNFNSDEIPMKMINAKANGMLNALSYKIQTETGLPYFAGESSASNMKSETYFGGSLFYNTSFGSRFGFSGFSLKANSKTSEVNLVDSVSVSPTGLNIVTTLKPLEFESNIPYRFMLSGEIIYNNFTLATEFTEQISELKTDYSFISPEFTSPTTFTYVENKFGKVYDRKDHYFYVMLSYLFKDQWTFSFLYDYAEIKELEQFNPVTGELFDALDTLDDKQTYRKDIGLGVRYDVNFNWSMKVEGHMVDGVFRSSSEILESHYDESSLSKEWSYFLAKISFNF
jgi:hypothetical protein